VILFLFENVIYVFLLLWLCILIVCLCMTTLTEVFPCFFLSCKANARVKPARTGRHGPHSSYFLCCSMYCLFCDVLCIVCVYICTELLPPGGYPVAVKYIIYHFGEMCFRIDDCSILKMKTICFSETSVDLYQTARRNISEQGNFQSLPWEPPISQVSDLIFVWDFHTVFAENYSILG
jgi:hypothetical protein